MQIEVTIQGLTALLMNRFTEKSELKVSNGTSPAFASAADTPRKEAKQKAYMDEEGKLYIPGSNIYAALISAGRFHKLGKSKVTTQKTSLVPAGLFMLDAAVPLNTTKFEVDSRSVVIPATGGRVMCHRPRLDEWRATFRLEVDETMFNEKFVRALIDDAGKKIGIGDFRPERKGPFGRFVVKTWKASR